MDCRRPCTKVTYQLSKYELTLSLTDFNTSLLYFGVEKTDIEIHEVYILSIVTVTMRNNIEK